MKRLTVSLLMAVAIHGLIFYWGKRWIPVQTRSKSPPTPLLLALAPATVQQKDPPASKTEKEKPSSEAPTLQSDEIKPQLQKPLPTSPPKQPSEKRVEAPEPVAPVKVRRKQPSPQPPAPLQSRPASRPPAAVPAIRIDKSASLRQPKPDLNSDHKPVDTIQKTSPSPAEPQIKSESASDQQLPPVTQAPRDQSSPGIQKSEDTISLPKRIDREAIPMYKENPPLRYPRLAKKRRYQGTVVLNVRVTKSGRAAEITIADSSNHAVLDQAAVTAVKNWRFEPGMRGNHPVDMWVKIPIRFRLK